jgi:hypothetical protein
MRPAETIANLEGLSGRGAGTDAERRAAVWLARRLNAATTGVRSRRTARIEPFWCRPNWALAHAWHAAMAVAGSLVSRASPQVDTVVLGFAACGAGHPRWWVSDGALVPLRYSKELPAICSAVAQEEDQPWRGHTGAAATRPHWQPVGLAFPLSRLVAWTGTGSPREQLATQA